MEQRVQNLEELCELITKQVVEQNKNIIDVNQNLITEIRSLRAAFVKQDVSELFGLYTCHRCRQVNFTRLFVFAGGF